MKKLCQNHRDRFASRERSGCQLNDFVYRGFRVSIFFSFSSTPTPPLENSTLRYEIDPFPPLPGKRTPSKASRYRRRLFPFSFSLSLPPPLSLSPRKRKERETGLVVPRFHSSLQLNGYSRGGLPCRERRVYPFNRKNRVRGSVTISRFSKYIAVIPNYTGEIIRKEKWKQ